MRHVAMLIIFSRRVLIRATLADIATYSIAIGALTVDNNSIVLEAMFFARLLQLQHASLNEAPPGPEGKFTCSNYQVGNYFLVAPNLIRSDTV
jgi:hypothetical protein